MITRIDYPCKFDRSLQPAMIHRAEGNDPRPLLVALHTWSCTFEADCSVYLEAARTYNWHMIFPHFRGPNKTPQACGSDMVVSDLEDAVEYMCSQYSVDPDRIYLSGGSGGGHCGLLMAARRPDLWTAVTAWCPISDIALWHTQCKGRNIYSDHIESVCGGVPAESPEAAHEARLRSPLTWLPNAVNRFPIDIGTGIHDGHTGSVPVGQAIRAYNALAAEKDRISEEDIAFIEQTETVPDHLKSTEQDPSFGTRAIYLRKQSNKVRLTLFEGGHDILPIAAASWLSRQSRNTAPDWNPGEAGSGTGAELSK